MVAQASFAQERIFLDEQIRFASKNNNNMYLIPQLYRITSSTSHVSVSRLYHALQAVIKRHNILRTALYLDNNGTIMQHCLEMNISNNDMKTYGFSVITLQNDENNCHIDKRINDIINQADLFDLSQGRVIHCHILRHYHSNDNLSFENDDLLSKNDFILFSMHHSAFDGTSTSIFLHELALAYETNCLLPMNDNTLQYMDYAVHERLMDVTSAREFWHSQLEGYNLEHSLSLSVDRHRSSTSQRSGLASTFQISFNNNISTAFLNYASSHHVTPFQLGLATFYAFLFKLSHGETNLCITSINANRYRTELQNMIGMFVATLPYRMELNPRWSFDELVSYVRDKSLSILEHSHYSLQNILADVQLNQSHVSFLETMFDFITITSDVNRFALNDMNLEQISTRKLYEITKFDFSLAFVYNPTVVIGQISCHLACSCDLFDETTVTTMVQRLEHLCKQLFSINPTTNQLDICQMPISQLNLILPEEVKEVEEIVFRRQTNLVNDGK